MNIIEALSKLDPADDHQWTEDGSPRVDVIRDLIGTKNVNRADITNAAPDFTRETAPERAVETQEDTDHAESSAEGEGEPEGQGQGDEAEAEAEEEVATEAEVEVEVEEVPPPVQLSKLEETKAERDVLSKEMDEAQKVASQAKETADRLADQVNTLNRQIDALEKLDPNHNTAGVRAFIKQQNQNRIARAKRLRDFIGDSGVNPNDLAKELDVRSPIDRAMAGRKAPRGSQRPVLPARQR